MISGETMEKKVIRGGFRNGTSEQLSQWGAMGGRPKEWTIDKWIWAAEVLLEWFQSSRDNIWVSDFQKETGIDTEFIFPYYQSLHQEESENESFVELVKKCKLAQEENILKGAWDKPARTGMAAFWLKNKRGWADKVEHQHSGDQMPFTLNFALLQSHKEPLRIDAPIIPIKLDKPPERLNETNETNETPDE